MLHTCYAASPGVQTFLHISKQSDQSPCRMGYSSSTRR